MMDHTNIPGMRPINQQLSGTNCTTPQQIVSRFGIMQAQDFNMAKWAIGIRLPGCTDKAVEEAFNNGEILRTHLLRPTWHFVAPEDIRELLPLTANRIMSSMKSRDRELGIDEKFYVKAYRIIQKALEGNNHLTREELMNILEASNIKVNASQMYHLFMGAELNGIVCSGAMRGKKHTYALLDERVPETKPTNKDETLAKLSRKYFTGHGPATLNDFVWWSGLSVAEARCGLESVKSEFVSETIDSQTYWIPNVDYRPFATESTVHLLPAFDEYIIGYKDRTAVLPPENNRKAVSSNGIFRPVIVKDGKVIGIWKRTYSAHKTIVPETFEKIDKATQQLIDKAEMKFKIFIE